ncbi:hypothetical protein FVE85_8814 [Porphyridium purpureum]|uniref:Uncharacterized protein n=1 Tax=Porphyridium purpureum TaxID=35688 RepID=A0A5J4YPK3_PORPP|nr:hypothetical protein FVE85_8814 [Porphyridium purpureum]|eukprot:POR4787..scf296_7
MAERGVSASGSGSGSGSGSASASAQEEGRVETAAAEVGGARGAADDEDMETGGHPKMVNGVERASLQGMRDMMAENGELGAVTYLAHSDWKRGGHMKHTYPGFLQAGKPVMRDYPLTMQGPSPDFYDGPVPSTRSRGDEARSLSDNGSAYCESKDVDLDLHPVECLMHAVAHCYMTTLAYHATLRNMQLRSVKTTVTCPLALLEMDLDSGTHLRTDHATNDAEPQETMSSRSKSKRTSNASAMIIRISIDADYASEDICDLFEYVLSRSPVTGSLKYPVNIPHSLDTMPSRTPSKECTPVVSLRPGSSTEDEREGVTRLRSHSSGTLSTFHLSQGLSHEPTNPTAQGGSRSTFRSSSVKQSKQNAAFTKARTLKALGVRDPSIDSSIQSQAHWLGGGKMRSMSSMRSGSQTWGYKGREMTADEPKEFLGQDSAPGAEVLFSSVSESLMMHAVREAKQYEDVFIEEIEFDFEGDVDLGTFLGTSPSAGQFSEIRLVGKIRGKGDPAVMEQIWYRTLAQSPIMRFLQGRSPLVLALTANGKNMDYYAEPQMLTSKFIFEPSSTLTTPATSTPRASTPR